MTQKIFRTITIFAVLSGMSLMVSGCGLFVLPSDPSEKSSQSTSASSRGNETEKAAAQEFIVKEFVDDLGTNNVTPSQYSVMDVEPFKDGYAGLIGYTPNFSGNVQSPPTHVQAYYIKPQGKSFKRIRVSDYSFGTTLGQADYDTSSDHNTLCRLWIAPKNPHAKNESLQQCMKDDPYVGSYVSKK